MPDVASVVRALTERSGRVTSVATGESVRSDEKMKNEIDEFVAAFFPEMQRIQGLKESDANKLRVSENWLRARLAKFAGNVREDCGRKSAARE